MEKHTLEELKALNPGAVIGWSVYYDGNHYGCAVLDLDFDSNPEEGWTWYQAGYNKDYTPEQLHEMVDGMWELVGQIAPSRSYEDWDKFRANLADERAANDGN